MGKKRDKQQFSMMQQMPASPPPFIAEQGIGFFSMLHKTWRMGNLQSVIESQTALQATRDSQMMQPYQTSVQMAEMQEKFIACAERTRQLKWQTEIFKAEAKTRKLKNVQLLLDNRKAEFEFKQLTAGEPEEK